MGPRLEVFGLEGMPNVERGGFDPEKNMDFIVTQKKEWLDWYTQVSPISSGKSRQMIAM